MGPCNARRPSSRTTPPTRPIFALACSALLGAIGCDPGWHYQAVAGSPVQADGLRYDVARAGNPKVRVYARAFTGSLDVELTLQNVDSRPLALRLPDLRITDIRGTSLPARYPVTRSCPVVDDAMMIRAGQACTLAKTFEISPLVAGALFPSDNPDLARISVELTLAHPKPFPDIRVPMIWMK